MALTSSDIKHAIKQAHPQDSHAVMFEVSEGTGAHSGRRADVLVMHLWPSRGLALHGYEVKVSRSDLAAELKNPDKAEAIAKFCDFWWIAAPKGMVNPLELPIPWGLVEVDEKGAMRMKKKAHPLTAQPINRNFLAAMLRARNKPDEAELALWKQNAETEIRERVRKELSHGSNPPVLPPGITIADVERAKEGLTLLRKVKEEFGIDFITHHPDAEFLRRWRLVKDWRWINAVSQLRSLVENEKLREHLKTLDLS